MALNPITTTASGMTAGQVTNYNPRMLKFAKPNLVHAQFADKQPIPHNVGKVTQLRRFIPLATVTDPLSETTIPDGYSISEEYVTATVYSYGAYIATGALFDLTHFDSNLANKVELVGDWGGRSVDEIVRDVMAATQSVQYANSKTSVYTLKTTDKMTSTEIKKAVRTLELAITPMFTRGGKKHYVAIVDPYTKYDIMSDSLWLDVAKYQNAEAVYDGELGRIYGVIFVETTVAKTYPNAVLKAGQKYLTAASLADTVVTIDEALSAAEAAALVDRYVNVIDATDATGATGERHRITAAAAGVAGAATVTLDAAPSAFTLADGDVLYANEYGWNANTVHSTMIFGAHAYAMFDLEGNMKTLIKNKGSAGTADPLDQFSTVGWKVEAMAVAILQDDWIINIKHGVSDD